MRLVILDRDGVINQSPGPGYITHPDQLQLIKGSAEAIAQLNQANINVAIATNQSGVGRGLMGQEDLVTIQKRLESLLKPFGAHIDATLTCTESPEQATIRRKPGPGMLIEALELFDADPSQTPFIGDSLTDLKAAVAANCLPVLVRTGHGQSVLEAGLPGSVAQAQIYDDLNQAVAALLQNFNHL